MCSSVLNELRPIAHITYKSTYALPRDALSVYSGDCKRSRLVRARTTRLNESKHVATGGARQMAFGFCRHHTALPDWVNVVCDLR